MAAVRRAVRHVRTVADLSRAEIMRVCTVAAEMKRETRGGGDPPAAAYANALGGKTLLMMFNKPSLRTRLSFETGMTQLGGHAIYYDLAGQNLGVKETFRDTAVVASSMVDVIMARVQTRNEIDQLAEHATVPVINALDDWAHPCQILADLQTVAETRPIDEKVRWAFVGDVANNVTFDIVRACAIMGHDVSVAGPDTDEFRLDQRVADEFERLADGTGARLSVSHDAREGASGADIVYSDSWNSYHIAPEEGARRVAELRPFQVTADVMAAAAPGATFMHCLPAIRGEEVTDEVIDGPQSVVYPQAENRLHAQKALLLFLLNKL